jgi:tetratricopeptide (TPR) repeat protein
MQSVIGDMFQESRSSGDLSEEDCQAFAMAARCLLEQQEFYEDAEFMYRMLGIEMPRDLVLKYAKSQWKKRKYQVAVDAYLIAKDINELHTAGERLLKKKDYDSLKLAMKCFKAVGAVDKIRELADKAFSLAVETKDADAHLWRLALNAFTELGDKEAMIRIGVRAMDLQDLGISLSAFMNAESMHHLDTLGTAAIAAGSVHTAKTCFQKTRNVEGLMRCVDAMLEQGRCNMDAWLIFDTYGLDVELPVDFFVALADNFLKQGRGMDALWFYKKIAEYKVHQAKHSEPTV